MTELVVPTKLIPAQRYGEAVSTIDVLGFVPEDQIWLDDLNTTKTRRANTQDVTHFANVLGIETPDQLHSANHQAVSYWEKHMPEVDDLKPSTYVAILRRR